jgi:hypothetical protein
MKGDFRANFVCKSCSAVTNKSIHIPLGEIGGSDNCDSSIQESLCTYRGRCFDFKHVFPKNG